MEVDKELPVGAPASRPDVGSCILSWTTTMVEKEQELNSSALLAMVRGRRPAVSPECLVRALESFCNVPRWNFELKSTFQRIFSSFSLCPAKSSAPVRLSISVFGIGVCCPRAHTSNS